MVIMIDITVESTGLSIKVLTFNSLYAIIAFDYYFAGWAATTFVRPHCYCLRDDFHIIFKFEAPSITTTSSLLRPFVQ
jgi:hypothetical protein